MQQREPTWSDIANIAAELGVQAGALKKWRQRGRVPHCWRLPLLGKFAERGMSFNPQNFEKLVKTTHKATQSSGKHTAVCKRRVTSANVA